MNCLLCHLHQIIYLEYGSRSKVLFTSQKYLQRDNAKMSANAPQKENSEISRTASEAVKNTVNRKLALQT